MVKEDLGVSLIPELALPKHFQSVKYIPLEIDFKRNIYVGLLKKNRMRNHLSDFIAHIESLPLQATHSERR